MDDEIKDWTIINYEFAGCHSIASNGDIYVVDNTGRNEVLVFNSTFKRVQTISGIEGRPHKVVWDNNRFYVLSSGAQTVYCYQVVNDRLQLEFSKKMDFMSQLTYCRSMKIINGFMYFASDSPSIIYKVNYLDNSFNLVETYPLPSNIINLVDIDYFDEHFYVTSYIDINKSVDLVNFTSIYNDMELVDVPYFITLIDDKIFFAEVGESRNAINSIDHSGVQEIYFKFNGLDKRSIKRRDMYPR